MRSHVLLAFLAVATLAEAWTVRPAHAPAVTAARSMFKMSKVPRPAMSADEKYDVVIIGTGPAGSTYARVLCGDEVPGLGIKGDKKVLMVDAGQKFSEKTGEHVKNSLLFQSDHAEGKRRFAQFIAATFTPISAPPDSSALVDVEPIVRQPGLDTARKQIPRSTWAMNLQNPDQDPYVNLQGASVSWKVGGMGTHWTCCCPRPHPTIEANDLFPSDKLYSVAEELLHVDQHVYDDEVRNVMVGDWLSSRMNHKLHPDYPVQGLPLAVKRVNEQFVDWTGPSEILGSLSEAPKDDPNFSIKSQTICKQLVFKNGGDGDVEYAVLYNPKTDQTTRVYADTFIVACGQVASAQLLFASGYTGSNAVGKYLTTQPLYFTRVALRKDLVDTVHQLNQFESVIDAWQQTHPDDPIPIPRSGKGSGEIQQWIPVQENRPWHVQIHIDNFYYGAEESTPVDDRLICGLRHFAVPQQLESNQVSFSDTQKDMMGMPQATFCYKDDMSIATRIHDMGKDCADVAFEIGSPIPSAGTMLQYLPDGSALHLHGCNRIGRDKDTSVCDKNGKVWGTNNLYCGGNGCIPNGIACNPTLTSVALALRGALAILGVDTSDTFHQPK